MLAMGRVKRSISRIERFMMGVTIIPDQDSCWNYEGSTNTHGYPIVKLDGKQTQASRVAYTLFVGPIPEGQEVRHKCDNRRCVRPSHLIPGTHQDNMNDKVERGRQTRGEDHPKAKLKEKDIPVIFRLYHQNHLTQQKIADRFDVSPQVINAVLKRRTWTHVSREL